MSNRRRWLLAALATLIALGALLQPAVYWRLYGWATGEPFCFGRPATFWLQEIQATTVGRRGSLVIRHPRHDADTLLGRAWQWLDRVTRGALSRGRKDAESLWNDPGALPVLTVLADDPDPKVRVFAVEGLTGLAANFPETRSAAVSVLQRAVRDSGDLDGREPKLTVGTIAAQELRFLGEN
jgi:hypothetical protein